MALEQFKNGTPKSLDQCLRNAIRHLRAVPANEKMLAAHDDLILGIFSEHLREYFNNRLGTIILLVAANVSPEVENVLIEEFRAIYSNLSDTGGLSKNGSADKLSKENRSDR